MDCNGLQWIAMDCNGLHWIAMDCNGLQWIAMDCNGLPLEDKVRRQLSWFRCQTLKLVGDRFDILIRSLEAHLALLLFARSRTFKIEIFTKWKQLPEEEDEHHLRQV